MYTYFRLDLTPDKDFKILDLLEIVCEKTRLRSDSDRMK